MFARRLFSSIKKVNIRKFSTDLNLEDLTFESTNTSNVKKNIKESEKLKKFREKLKRNPHDVTKIQDPFLIEIDPKSGEFRPDSEEDPTKWGDWQHGGRVSDF